MSDIPLWIVLPIAVIGISVVVGRWILVNETTLDRRINSALSWYVGALALYGSAATLHLDGLAPQLFLVGGVLAGANLYGFARTLADGDTAAAPLRQRRYHALAAAVAIAVLVGPPTLFTVVWLGCNLLGMVSGLFVALACVRELRTAGSSTTEKLAYWGLLVVVLYWELTGTVTIWRAMHGSAPQNAGIAWIAAAGVAFAILAGLIAVPLVLAIMALIGWDSSGRACRRLQPLWRDLTDAMPEVVLSQEQASEQESAPRLYRMTVEIQDAALHLRPYMPDLGTDQAIRPETSVADYALRLAYAVQIKARGNAFGYAADPERYAIPPATGDRTSELQNLLEFAREWPKARARAAAFTYVDQPRLHP
ncbi:MAB_1171c family putative transporter [Nocardia sp. XZ_19_369]|uniref:MAB_1171c family putative transporter n=1 Tax=Nocardia sp. XZ_19_369 TaxID=2769487 RepID=UPI00188E72B7|nr:MAB_1171c family putative transporter [Nocardia sp. XZ_19_369]